MNYLDFIISSQKLGELRGIPSICSAHPFVLEAALSQQSTHPKTVLIEATCNQVNQFGGYTGMKPADFMRFVSEIADQMKFPRHNLLFGGDHLGPLVWAKEPSAVAMKKAGQMVNDYVCAGFAKIHIDCSVACADDQTFTVADIARRTADLVRVAEDAAVSAALDPAQLPRYVIGSEVPTAGGVKVGENQLRVTDASSAAETLELTKKAFTAQGLESTWERVIALVVQPGVEFGDDEVHEYDQKEASALSRFIETIPGMIYEAHSTDYQPRNALNALVEDHFGILKVGPALTFAFREAAFALAEIEEKLVETETSHLRETLETAMLNNPAEWQKHYGGTSQHQRIARAFSFSDRIRYYWNYPTVKTAFNLLLNNLGNDPLPLSLISQYLPIQYEKIRDGQLTNHPRTLLLSQVKDVLDDYQFACSLK
jgi:D-tagatose-1,6-bisphosphate aldolase subunit GatZ/KbaZ